MSKSQHTAASKSMTINNDKLVPETHIQNIIFSAITHSQQQL